MKYFLPWCLQIPLSRRRPMYSLNAVSEEDHTVHFHPIQDKIGRFPTTGWKVFELNETCSIPHKAESCSCPVFNAACCNGPHENPQYHSHLCASPRRDFRRTQGIFLSHHVCCCEAAQLQEYPVRRLSMTLLITIRGSLPPEQHDRWHKQALAMRVTSKERPMWQISAKMTTSSYEVCRTCLKNQQNNKSRHPTVTHTERGTSLNYRNRTSLLSLLEAVPWCEKTWQWRVRLTIAECPLHPYNRIETVRGLFIGTIWTEILVRLI